MAEHFAKMLAVGGKTNSLGKVEEVIEIVSKDNARLNELYECVFDEDAWVRMRAADALEKICRKHSGWIEEYVDRFQKDLSSSTQPSIQWHLAQIYCQVRLSAKQKSKAIKWLQNLLSQPNVDWIVAANAMDTLMQFTNGGAISKTQTIPLIEKQLEHKSKSVVRKASKHISTLGSNK